MIVTSDNWESVRETLLSVGIDHVDRTADGRLLVVYAKDGARFEFTRESFDSLKAAELLRLGTRIYPFKE